MTPLYRVSYALILSALLIIAGCASSSSKKNDEDLEPARLQAYQPGTGLKKRWARQVGKGLGENYNRIDPVLIGDRILAVSVDGVAVLLDRTNGDIIWKKRLGIEVSGGIGVASHNNAPHNKAPHFYLGSSNGEILCFQLEDGQESWRKSLSGEILSAPVSDGNLLVVHTFDGKVYGLDEKSGEQRWVFAATMPLLTMRGNSAPVLYDELVLVGSANGKLVALDKETGQLRWEQRIAIAQGKSEIERIVDVDATPLVTGGLVYAVSFQGRIVALDAASGRPVWQASESSYSDMTTGFGNVYVLNAQSELTAYSKTDGSTLWTQNELLRRQLSAPQVLNSYIAVGDYEGYIHLLSQVDGRIAARRKVDRTGLRSAVVVKGNDLYAYGNSGKLVAYELDAEAPNYGVGAPIPQRDEIMRKPGMFPYSWYE